MKENLCPKCKHPNRSKARFCSKCGALLDSNLELYQSSITSPLFYWIKEKIWKVMWFQFIFFIFIPPFVFCNVLTKFVLDKKVLQVTSIQICWLTSAYWAILWAFLSYNIIKPNPHILYLSFIAGVFTAFVGTILIFIVTQLPIIGSVIELVKSDYVIGRMTGFVLGVGVSEEFVKILPLIYYLKKSQNITKKDWIFLGVCSGLGFGVTEAVQYVYGLSPLISFGVLEGDLDPAYQAIFYMLRNSVLPFLHGLWTGIVGYYIGLSKQKGQINLLTIIVGLFISIVLHGLYNSFAIGIISILIVIVSLLIFASCVHLSAYNKI